MKLENISERPTNNVLFGDCFQRLMTTTTKNKNKNHTLMYISFKREIGEVNSVCEAVARAVCGGASAAQWHDAFLLPCHQRRYRRQRRTRASTGLCSYIYL
jgi:hypothetical protein